MTILGHMLNAGGPNEEWLLELLLEPTEEQPPFAGDVGEELSFVE